MQLAAASRGEEPQPHAAGADLPGTSEGRVTQHDHGVTIRSRHAHDQDGAAVVSAQASIRSWIETDLDLTDAVRAWSGFFCRFRLVTIPWCVRAWFTAVYCKHPNPNPDTATQ